jgi:hypothetical protein
LHWVALMLSMSTVLRAAEPSPAPVTATAPPAEEASAAGQKTDGGNQEGSSASDEAAATRKANERFNPSEKISEDLSVSFPSDI